MCTLSIIAPDDSALRTVMNRDESVARPPAHAPRWCEVDAGVRAIWPTDPVSGGTWIGATTRGLVLAVMNSTAGKARTASVSRGTIIPSCAGARTVRDVAERIRAMRLADCDSFRMTAFDAAERRGLVLEWDGAALRELDATTPHCMASSGLGDELVQERVELFKTICAQADGASHGLRAMQNAFHLHQWPDRPHLSVRMSRPGYRTVSITTLELSPGANGQWQVSMEYQPLGSVDDPGRGARSNAPIPSHQG